MNVEILARLQFALTVMFHYIFPSLTIGLSGLLVWLEWRWLRTGNRQYESLAKFWTQIFALSFAVGVASGVVMEFQFGTNWAAYSRYVGDIFGSALAAEGIFAFFLESVFLGIMVFGWGRISPRMHFFSTCMVALGAVLSSVWIVVANSWQQTPAGFVLRNGRAELADFAAAVLNPSLPHRLLHVWIGSYIEAAFFMTGVGAYYVLKARHVEMGKICFRVGLVVALVGSLLALVSGDAHGRNVAQYQPAKLAAMEGHFVTGTGPTPIYLIGLPDEQSQTVMAGVKLPGLLSFLVHRNFQTPVTGLDKFPRSDWPPVAPTFLTFHAMVGLGMLFIGLTLFATVLFWRGQLFESRGLLWVFVWAVPLPFLANQFGWCAAEIGRQPWVVYGLLRTSDAVSKSVTASQV
ncbi:MAG: cytochrome ubiquinol oxidase subunit I, partial [Verrucomicrobiae bacterium]|nr:cytochrome ubiquinol oxidase subunit I [Verrucomicrobiae bacterium]